MTSSKGVDRLAGGWRDTQAAATLFLVHVLDFLLRCHVHVRVLAWPNLKVKEAGAGCAHACLILGLHIPHQPALLLE